MQSTLFSSVVSILLSLQCLLVVGQAFPEKPNRLVNDYAHVLSHSQEQLLEKKLHDFHHSTSTQIALVLLNSVGTYDITDYGVQLARKWGIGAKGKNNGILLLLAIKDRKVTIQTGYGLEGALPDVIAQQIINQDIKPQFRKKHYYLGLDAATNSLIKYTKGEYKPDQKQLSKSKKATATIVIIVTALLLVAISYYLINRDCQVISSHHHHTHLPWWATVFGAGMAARRGRQYGGALGGFGGSSFSGFGGGTFGGGGASGSW